MTNEPAQLPQDTDELGLDSHQAGDEPGELHPPKPWDALSGADLRRWLYDHADFWSG